MPWTGVIDASEPNTGGHRQTRPIRKEIWNRRICQGERIPRIADWHADPSRAECDACARLLERIGRKRHSCQRGIKERPRDFEIGKHRQVFVAQIARKRAIEVLPVCRRQGRCESGKVEEEVIPTAFVISPELGLEYPRVVYTRCAGIRIRINDKRVLIEWRS